MPETRRIFEAQKKAHLLSAEERAVKRKRIIERHHHAQRLLEQVTVRIPFAHLLDFPVSWTRGRRRALRTTFSFYMIRVFVYGFAP